MGLFDLLSSTKRKAARARKLELQGELTAAAELYVAAEQPDEAARVLLLRADAEADPERRIVLCAQAARIGAAGTHGQEARRRKALLSFDLARATAGAAMGGALASIAAELEACGEWRKAAEAFVLAGDTESEIRVLRDAGAIEQLEGRLQQEADQDRLERERRQLLRRIADLDRVAERREALRLGGEWLDQQDDEIVRIELDRIRSRLVSGPSLQLEVDGRVERYALGSEVSIGRANATIIVHSQAVSRQHLRVFRQDDQPWVEDLGTRNGTTLAGARLDAPLPVGAGVDLRLAGQVDCRLSPADPAAPWGSVVLEAAGSRTILPLGAQRIGSWQLVDAHDGQDRFVLLRAPEGSATAILGGFRLARQIELCVGDEIQEGRDGPTRLRVPPQVEP